MIMVEIFCLGLLLGIVPIIFYIAKQKMDEMMIKFNNTKCEMKDSTEKLFQIHHNALKNYDEQNKKIEKLQTELAILKSSNLSQLKRTSL